VLQRRRSRWKGPINLLMLSGLIVPPAVVPTIWVMQTLGIFKTLPGLMDGASPFGLFFRIVFPLLRPVIVTVVVAQSVFVWSNYDTSYNLLFADIVLITIPPLLLFLFFQRHIVAGLTAGSVKG
jgi:raffinose/stachyose/melibiose transport system permease protein